MLRGENAKFTYFIQLLMPARKFKILLVEDDLPTIDIYEEILKKSGFDIETLKWGKDAFELLERIKEGKEKKPGLILLDLILPDVNGVEI